MTTTLGCLDVGGSVLGRLVAVGLLVLALAPARAVDAQGVTRELVCRGNTGMALRVDMDPSPRDTANVVMVLEYTRSTKALGGDFRTLDPGTCSWNPVGAATTPPEPGRVRFDVRREAQRWSATERRMMDTTVRAAVFLPDPITLPRYLLDPKNYWKFYVNDVTGLSTSHMAAFESGTPTYVWITGAVQLANDVRRDLLCRGGTTGLLWGGGTTVGNNLAKVQLSYRVSPTVPGATGSGLAPGSCAWTSRTAMPPEPGKIWFITAANAQLRQMQSGTTVDRTPTAAERYPDMRSIPEYLKDPAHYWTFAVVSRDPDSAVTNGVWKRDLTSVVAGTRDAATSTVRTQPTTSGTGSQPYSPGASTTSRATSLFDIRNVTVTAGLEGVVIRFEAAANSKPTVTLTPVAGGAPISLAVSSGVATSSGMVRYSAASQAKLARNTSYNYAIAATATAQARANSKSGTAKTLGQYLTVSISRIDILSDGDKDGNGEIYFYFESCPKGALSYDALMQKGGAALDWTEGPHPTTVELKNAEGSTPDQVRIVPWMFEDDFGLVPFQGRNARPVFTCASQGAVEPRRTPTGEWNSLVMDIDLTKYPGAKAGDSFVRRSKPLANGSTVSFEIRGAFLITRQ